MHYAGSDFVLNAPIFMSMQGNVPSIIQQISNIVEFSINIMLVTDHDKAQVTKVLSQYIDCNNLMLCNVTEFLYHIAKLDKTPVYFMDGCSPNIDLTVLTKFADNYTKNPSRIQASMVKNFNSIFTDDFSEIRYENEKVTYKDGLLFCIKAHALMHLFIQTPTMSTIDLLDAYMSNIGQKGLTCYIVEDTDTLKFTNMRVKMNWMRMRDPVVVV